MRIASVALFCSEYALSLANALSTSDDVELWLSRENLASSFPGIADVKALLQEQSMTEPRVSVRLVNSARGRFLRRFRLARQVSHSVLACHPDVVHYQSGGNLYAPLMLARLRRQPLVVTIHDVNPHPGDFPPPRVIRLVTHIATRLADQVIVHGNQQSQVLQAEYGTPASKINVVQMGAFLLFRRFMQQTIDEEPNLILFFGRIRAYKGIQYLLDAVPLVTQAVPTARFIIAGRGDSLEQYGYRPDQSEHVIVDGRFIPMAEVAPLFQRAAVVVLPYTDASQSGVVNLAYAFGKPVVCTRVGSIPEIVDDGRTGYLVEPRDATQLANAIIRLLSDPPARRQMGHNALYKAETELSWTRVAAETTEVYRRAMGAKRR
jgi:starch synthase